MRRLLIAFVIVVVSASGVARAQAPAAEALDGLDPVLLVQGREVSGKPEIKIERGGFVYLFSSPETRATFEGDPARYEIQLGGMCARMGGGARGNPADFYVHDGRIYVFGSDECHKRFIAAPAKYIPPAAEPMPTSATALADGRRLLDRAAAGLGDAARLDRLTSYAETVSQTQMRPMGEATITTKTLWQFPASVRRERVVKLQDRTSQTATILNPSGAWFVMGARAFPTPEAGLVTLQFEVGRQPVALLRARKDPSLKAASLGRGTMAGTEVDRVRVQRGAVDVTLGLDPSSGRLHSATFVDRGPEGEFGTYTIQYSDFKPVEDGLTLPFTIRALFNGQPDSALSWTVDAIAIDPPVDASLFQPPSGGGK